MPIAQRATFSSSFIWILAVLLAIAHGWWGLAATTTECTAYDEIAYVVAGHTYWRDNDFRLQPENGILPQRLAALPTLFIPWHMPGRADPAWRDSDVWKLGTDAFYHLGNNTDYVLFLARAASSLHGVALMLLIFAWSSRLFGYVGGFTSLLLYGFCPNFLGHGALATSDVAAAFWLTASTGAYWRFLQYPSWSRTIVSGLCLGLAAVAKYSVVLLGPVWIVLLVLRLTLSQPVGFGRSANVDRARTIALLVGTTLLQVAVALTVIWSFYGWHADAFNPSIPGTEYFHPWSQVLDALGPRARPFVWLRSLHVVPDAYAYGLSNVIAFAGHRAAFLNGAVNIVGWPSFFPYAFLVKTPLPLFAILLVATVIGLGRWKQSRSPHRPTRFYPLAALFVIYWAASLTSHLNIGLRHLLPVYPPLFIIAGGAGRALWGDRRLGRAVLAVLLGTAAAVSWQIWPNDLAYFNAFAGGPTQGYRHLVDSSLDWGQDLPKLAAWQDQHIRPGELLTLSYFGMGDPVYEGISARHLPCQPVRLDTTPNALKPGWYVVSATMLQQVYNPVGRTWSPQAEHSFQALRPLEVFASAWDKNGPEGSYIKKEFRNNAVARSDWQQYEWLRFARLCEYLRARKPDAEIGYSLLVYNVTADELHRAVFGSVSDLARLMEEAGVPSAHRRANY